MLEKVNNATRSEDAGQSCSGTGANYKNKKAT